jgi:hypothetical protein
MRSFDGWAEVIFGREAASIDETPGALARVPVERLPLVFEQQQVRDLLDARSVALVEGGARLSDARLGPEIDGHDVVVRFGQIVGDGADIGGRTDLHVVDVDDALAWTVPCSVRICAADDWVRARAAYRDFLVADRQTAIGAKSMTELWPPVPVARSIGTGIIDSPEFQDACQRIERPSTLLQWMLFAIASGARSVTVFGDVCSECDRNEPESEPGSGIQLAGPAAESEQLLDRVLLAESGGSGYVNVRRWQRPDGTVTGTGR